MKLSTKSWRLLLMLALCFSVCGCGQTDAEKLIAESKEVESWAASARMIATAWAQGKVPTAYAQRSFETINQQLSDSATRIQSHSDKHQPQLIATLQELLKAVSQLQAAATQQNKSAVHNLDGELSAATNTLNSIVEDASQAR